MFRWITTAHGPVSAAGLYLFTFYLYMGLKQESAPQINLGLQPEVSEVLNTSNKQPWCSVEIDLFAGATETTI